MTFLFPAALWLLLAVPPLIAGYIFVARRREKNAYRFLPLLSGGRPGRGGWRRHLPPALLLLALIVLILASARPAATITLAARRGTVILAMDVSGSMRADDVQPTRITAAQIAAKAFVNDRPSKVKIGIVAFSGAAFVVQTPTDDNVALNQAIDGLMPERMTAIGSAVLVSMQTLFPAIRFDSMLPGFGGEEFTSGGASGNLVPGGVALGGASQKKAVKDTSKITPVEPGSYKSAAIILMTDGKNTDGPDPVDAARIASNFGVRVFTIGFGTNNGQIHTYWGRTMHVVLDEETLKSMANITHGQYFHAQTETELAKIYKDLNTRLQNETETREITAFFVAAALLMTLVSASLSVLWFGRIV
ncbi:MAG TPA: VWA domain-containing protein [Rhizomicrobium sp.]|nr:VWA domain-containing protein [Rhizomicrobium sp.]